MKSTLYLIQAKNKLPTIYNCLRKRNFLLLSYKTETSDTTIFAPNTTWTEGRNLLYEYVREHKLIYDYYVFMDEDIILFPTSQASKYPLELIWSSCTYLLYKFIPQSKFSQIQENGFASLEAVFELNFPIITQLIGFIYNKELPFYRLNSKLPKGFCKNLQGRKSWFLQTIPIFDNIIVAISQDAFFAER